MAGTAVRSLMRLSVLVNCDMHSTYNSFFFFFNDTATTEIYTLSLHDALPIYVARPFHIGIVRAKLDFEWLRLLYTDRDRKSTRLNSSHSQISYAVFCLKKKKRITRYE